MRRRWLTILVALSAGCGDPGCTPTPQREEARTGAHPPAETTTTRDVRATTSTAPPREEIAMQQEGPRAPTVPQPQGERTAYFHAWGSWLRSSSVLGRALQY